MSYLSFYFVSTVEIYIPGHTHNKHILPVLPIWETIVHSWWFTTNDQIDFNF